MAGEPPLSAATTIEITVTDGNDHAPTFLGLPYSTVLVDETSGPLLLLSAMATDLDEGTNGEIEFTLQDSSGIHTTFCL